MTSSVEPISISVVIRTFNSAKTLDRALGGLKLKSDEEYIVVDSGSTDSTLAIAAARGAKIIRAEGPFNYSKSLNLGFRAARNPWVLVISSHTISVVPDLLGVFREAAQDFPPDVVVGYAPNSLSGRGVFADESTCYCDRENYMTVYHFCGNANTLYRRSAWEEMPFDEGIRTSEDKAWLSVAIEKGYRIAFVSKARTINLTQYSLRYMFMKGYSDSRAELNERLTVFNLIMALGSHTKKFLRGGMPVGSWARYSAHIVGRYFASYGSRNNIPGK